MGVALYVAVQGKDAGSAEWGMSGKPLGQAYSQLEHLLDDAGLTSLYDFVGNDASGELPDFKKKWFAPGKILPSAQKLLAYVEGGGEPGGEGLVTDLRDMVRILEAAKKAKHRAMVAMDI